MIRRFKFESDIYETLDCVPMAVRRKLDKVGLKIGLEQWRALGRGERLAICHLPCNTNEECEVLRTFIREAVAQRGAGEIRQLSEGDRPIDSSTQPPPELVSRANELGFTVDEASWGKLDGDERYALAKVVAGHRDDAKLRAALEEMLPSQVEAQPVELAKA